MGSPDPRSAVPVSILWQFSTLFPLKSSLKQFTVTGAHPEFGSYFICLKQQFLHLPCPVCLYLFSILICLFRGWLATLSGFDLSLPFLCSAVFHFSSYSKRWYPGCQRPFLRSFRFRCSLLRPVCCFSFVLQQITRTTFTTQINNF